MIVDACVAIALLNSEDRHHGAARQLILKEIEQPRRMPPLTMAECLVAHARAGTATIALGRLQDLGITPDGTGVDPLALAMLRSETGLTMPDCVVLLAAEQASEPLATFDERLAAAAASRRVRVFGSDRG